MTGPRGVRSVLLLALFLAAGACASGYASEASQNAHADPDSVPQVGPENGALVLAGGGELAPEVWDAFLELAGGDSARIVLIPTAAAEEDLEDRLPTAERLRNAGAREVTVLHTRDREEADAPDFSAPLENATGVWISGGRQWRLVDAYLHTRTHRKLYELLTRGGVVGGNSAGASILASFLARGDPETNDILIAPEYQEGFGFLAGAAVDQHLLARNRQDDLWELIYQHPELLGVGIDEGTAAVVQGNRAEVVGPSGVAFYNGFSYMGRPVLLKHGEVYDLGHRLVVVGRAVENQLDPKLDPELDFHDLH